MKKEEENKWRKGKYFYLSTCKLQAAWLVEINRINRTPFRRRSRLEVCVSVFVCIIRTDERYLNTPVDT